MISLAPKTMVSIVFQLNHWIAVMSADGGSEFPSWCHRPWETLGSSTWLRLMHFTWLAWCQRQQYIRGVLPRNHWIGLRPADGGLEFPSRHHVPSRISFEDIFREGGSNLRLNEASSNSYDSLVPCIYAHRSPPDKEHIDRIQARDPHHKFDLVQQRSTPGLKVFKLLLFCF